MDEKALTYTSYLRVDDLLALQQPRSPEPEHDEMLFIVIHQVHELWFKQLLHESIRLQQLLGAGDASAALHGLRRMLTIMKTMVTQMDIMETMTPLSFNSFRGRLESASGFQSAQFREWEAVLGRRDERVLSGQPPGPARDRIRAAMERPSLYDSLLAFAGADPADPAPALARAYAEDGLPAMVCERMLDLDEGVQEWRYRHVKMVERTIGGQTGSGGSTGADYLRRTLFRPAFPALWEVRNRF